MNPTDSLSTLSGYSYLRSKVFCPKYIFLGFSLFPGLNVDSGGRGNGWGQFIFTTLQTRVLCRIWVVVILKELGSLLVLFSGPLTLALFVLGHGVMRTSWLSLGWINRPFLVPEGANGGLSLGPSVVCLELPFVALLQGTHYIQEGSVSTTWALLVLLVNFVNLILFHEVSLVSLCFDCQDMNIQFLPCWWNPLTEKLWFELWVVFIPLFKQIFTYYPKHILPNQSPLVVFVENSKKGIFKKWNTLSILQLMHHLSSVFSEKR